ALLLPQQFADRATVIHTLVTRPGGIVAANPLAPVAPVNAARLVSELTVDGAKEKIGVVLRSCEVRALVELTKLRQASLDNLLIIGVDCVGTFEPVDYRMLLNGGKFDFASWLQKAAAGQPADVDGLKIRRACTMCDEIVPGRAHFSIGWVGSDPSQELVIEGGSELPAEKFGLSLREGLPGREKLIGELKAQKAAQREALCAEFSQKVNTAGAFLRELGACLRCYNCRAACPLCVCQECIFISPLFKHDLERYLERANIRALVEMPADTALFHLTRLVHVGLSCVGCGQCETACPGRLPLSVMFRTVGRKVQQIFDYVPGRSVEEKLPLVTYKMAELEPQ
ncbi:MAG: Coenzyme F420 hydrogenase/dehydrogenase, beta subunit C-terminal domain, partial [Bacillota bacterium]